MAKSVLVVDDCGTTRKLISFLLKGKGYSAVHASNGIEALEKLATADVDIIITDLNMPQMDGLELIKNLRSDEKYKAMPIIMVSTESAEMDKKMAKDLGASTYIVKPVTQDRLVYEIEKLI